MYERVEGKSTKGSYSSGIILYLIYGVGGRDIAEKVAAKKKRQQFFAKLTGKFKKECV